MLHSALDLITRPRQSRTIMLRTISSITLAIGFFVASPADAFAQLDRPPADEVLQVHGSWSVSVVRDGRVVYHREFQNALTSDGEQHLVGMLTGVRTAGPWVILAATREAGPLCADNDLIIGEDTDCAISEFEGEATVTFTPDDTLLLEGSETVVRDGEISTVLTAQWWCAQTVAPSDCAPTGSGDSFSQFTLKPFTIPGTSPIPVQTGDRLDITVEISFGTLSS